MGDTLVADDVGEKNNRKDSPRRHQIQIEENVIDTHFCVGVNSKCCCCCCHSTLAFVVCRQSSACIYNFYFLLYNFLFFKFLFVFFSLFAT